MDPLYTGGGSGNVEMTVAPTLQQPHYYQPMQPQPPLLTTQQQLPPQYYQQQQQQQQVVTPSAEQVKQAHLAMQPTVQQPPPLSTPQQYPTTPQHQPTMPQSTASTLNQFQPQSVPVYNQNHHQQQQHQHPHIDQYSAGQQIPYTLPNGGYVQSPVGGHGGAPPMPEVMNAYNAMYNNALMGGLNGKPGVVGTGNGDRQPTDILDYAVEPKTAYSHHVTADLQDAWKQVEKLDLLDTKRLDQMYMYQDTFVTDKKFLFTYLCSEYRNKYAALFEKYESLEVYVSFVVLMLIYSNEAELKKACDDNTNFLHTPRVGESALKLSLYKRKFAPPPPPSPLDSRGVGPPAETEVVAHAKRMRLNEENDKTPPVPTLPPTTTTKTPTTAATAAAPSVPAHPFFGTPLYRSHTSLFKLGEMVKYCVPSEFAVLFCHANLQSVNVFTQGDKKTTHKGIRVTFSKAVVALIRSRTNKTFTFQSLEYLGALKEFMTEITGKLVDQEPFRLSSLKEMKMWDLTKNVVMAKLDWESESGFNIASITNFACTSTTTDVLSNRAYSTPVYHIPKSFVDVEENDLDDMCNKATNNVKCSERVEELNTYYDLVDPAAVDAGETTAENNNDNNNTA